MVAINKKEFLIQVAIVLLAVFLFSIGTRTLSYSSPDEKRYMRSAREMVISGDWVTPRFHGKTRFQKPPLFYWLSAGSIVLFGDSNFSTRFPSALCGAFTVLIAYLLGGILYSRRAGLFSASLLAVSYFFFFYARLATPDMLIVFLISLVLLIFARIYFQNVSRVEGSLLFVALALAVLAKGFIGLLLPLIIIILFASLYKKGRLIRNLSIPIGTVLFLMIALPWFIAMIRIHGDAYVNHVWQVETINRVQDSFTSDGCIFTNIAGTFLKYILRALIIFLPATLLLPWAIAHIARKKKDRRPEAFLAIWIFAVIIFFTLFGTRKVHYLLPAALPICMITGNYLAYLCSNKRRTGLVQRSLITLCLVYVFTFGYLMPQAIKNNGLLMLSRYLLTIKKEGELVSVGSNHISHNRVGSYLGMRPLKLNRCIVTTRANQIEYGREVLTEFFNTEERVYCFITNDDYKVYITDSLKKRLYIIGKDYYWRKPNQLSIKREELVGIITNGKPAFNRVFKNKILLISNKK